MHVIFVNNCVKCIINCDNKFWMYWKVTQNIILILQMITIYIICKSLEQGTIGIGLVVYALYVGNIKLNKVNWGKLMLEFISNVRGPDWKIT